METSPDQALDNARPIWNPSEPDTLLATFVYESVEEVSVLVRKAEEEYLPTFLRLAQVPNGYEGLRATHLQERLKHIPSLSGDRELLTELTELVLKGTTVADAVDGMAWAIFEAIHDCNIKYVHEPPGSVKGTQRLRIVPEVVKKRHATCVDLALLFASCLLRWQIDPVLMLVSGPNENCPNHILLGYWTFRREDTTKGEMVLKDALPFAQDIEADRLQLVEATDCAIDGVPFTKTHACAKAWLPAPTGWGKFYYALDIAVARTKYVLPNMGKYESVRGALPSPVSDISPRDAKQIAPNPWPRRIIWAASLLVVIGLAAWLLITKWPGTNTTSGGHVQQPLATITQPRGVVSNFILPSLPDKPPGGPLAPPSPYSPTIAEEPKDQILTNGETATFNVVATGSPPLGYQWYYKDQPVLGATNHIYVLQASRAEQSGEYHCAVSNAAGVTNSRTVRLDVQISPPSIVFSSGDHWVFAGDNATNSVNAAGSGPLTYQWICNGQDITGASQSTLIATNLLENTASHFRVIVSNRLGAVRCDLVLRVLTPIHKQLEQFPLGEFVMGTPQTWVKAKRDGAADDETTQLPRKVSITKVFWMSKYEITQAQYMALMGMNPSKNTNSLDQPVENVPWAAASDFCSRLTILERRLKSPLTDYVYRLPTEAEWEFACRNGTETRFNFGNDENEKDLAEHGWFDKNSENRPHPVGRKDGGKQDHARLFDIHGNVAEWCRDSYSKISYANDITVDPKGLAAAGGAAYRVVRGGAYDSQAVFCRSAARDFRSPEKGYPNVGFRVVLAPEIP